MLRPKIITLSSWLSILKVFLPFKCGSNAFQVYFDDAKDSSQESRIKASFKNQRVVQSKQVSRIKIKVKIQEKTQLR